MPKKQSGWTINTLREDMLARIEGLDRLFVGMFNQSKERVDLALASSKEAVNKAEIATEKRFDAVNEFRGALSDQANKLMPRSEYEVQHQALVDRISDAASAITKIEAKLLGKSEGIGNIGVVVLGIMTGLSTIAAIAAVVIAYHK